MTSQVPAIKRAFSLIELLAKQGSGLGISELHRSLSLPLSTVATIVYTLASLGYLERDTKTARYYLSVKLLGIAHHALEHVDLIGKCHGVLEELVRESGLTGHIAVRRGYDSMYVDKVVSDGLIQISSYIGLRWPLHTSAAGKALLAFLPDEELNLLVKDMSLKKLTANTITSKQLLMKQLQMFRRLGFSSEINEGELGIACIAAPLFGSRQELSAVVSLTGTTHQITKAKTKTLGALIKVYARNMSFRIGYTE